MQNDIIVSVCTIAYNQKNYIAKCIDGILEQKTNFKIELLINDDASTDGTDEIIRNYSIKYTKYFKMKINTPKAENQIYFTIFQELKENMLLFVKEMITGPIHINCRSRSII